MRRDFNSIDENGVPNCFGDCEELNEVCLQCPREIRDRCIDETIDNDKRKPTDFDYFGEPNCLGKYYSEYSKICNEECEYLTVCKKTVTNKPNKVHLPVINSKPSSNVSDPYKTKVTPFSDSKPTYYTTPSTQSNVTVSSVPKQYMSNETIERQYGVKPHPNPIVPGQFEGEEWYERLGKEFVLRTGESAIKVFAELLLTMFSRIKWAPKVKHD